MSSPTKQPHARTDYPLIAGGRSIETRNDWVKETYRRMISSVVREYPETELFNVNQVTERVNGLRENWQQFCPRLPKAKEWTFPKGRTQRKVVSEHLREMQRNGQVTRVGGLYISMRGYVQKYASDFHQSVVQLIKTQDPEKSTNIPGGDVAGCYAFSYPRGAHYRFQDILNWQEKRFRDGVFWLDDILMYAISIGGLSRSAYSKKGLDKESLKKGWKTCFGDAKLVVLAFALSPPKFLEFLNTYPGRAIAKARLERKWDEISARGEKNRPRYEHWRAAYSEEAL